MVKQALKDSVKSTDPHLFVSIHRVMKQYKSKAVFMELIKLLEKTKKEEDAVFILSLLDTKRDDLGETERKRFVAEIRRRLNASFWSCRMAAIRASVCLEDDEIGGVLLRKLVQKKETRKKILLEIQKVLGKLYSDAPRLRSPSDNWASWWKNRLKQNGKAIPDYLKSYESVEEVGGYGKKPISHVSYFSHKIESDRFVLITDYSYSMGPIFTLTTELKKMRRSYLADIPEKIKLKKHTLDVISKHELVIRKQIELISLMPEDVRFNLLFFGANHVSFKAYKKDVLATLKNKQAAIDFLTKASLSKATQIYEALVNAMQNRDADTFYLLTDGRPYKSLVMDTDVITRACYRWDVMRQIEFNIIDLGPIPGGVTEIYTRNLRPNDFLRDVAAHSGGKYALFNDLKNITFYVPEK
jgi:hypothetical protein